MSGEPCDEETYSWWHFTPEQIDPYWIRCTLAIPHDVHEDEHTGLTWTPSSEGAATLRRNLLKIKNDPLR